MLKVLGVVWVLRAIAQVPRLVGVFATRPSQFSPGDYRLVIAGEFASFILHVGIGWLLVAGGGLLAGWLFPNDSGVQVALTAEDCLGVAIAVVGAVVVAVAVPRLGEAIVNFKYLKDADLAYTKNSWLRGNWVALLGSVAEVVVGVGLFVSSRSLAAAWGELGPRGQSESRDEDDAP